MFIGSGDLLNNQNFHKYDKLTMFQIATPKNYNPCELNFDWCLYTPLFFQAECSSLQQFIIMEKHAQFSIEEPHCLQSFSFQRYILPFV